MSASRSPKKSPRTLWANAGIVEKILSVLAAIVTLGTTLGSLWGAPVSDAPDPIQVPSPANQSRSWDSQSLFGEGFEGKVWALSQEYSWALGSEAHVTFHGEVQPDGVIRRHLREPGLQGDMARATDLIALGIASREGEPEAQKELAEKRADQLLVWLRESLPDNLPERRPDLWRLNLGKREGQPAEVRSTHRERRIVILCIQRKKSLDRKELEKGLKQAMLDTDALRDVNPHDYLEFELTRR